MATDDSHGVVTVRSDEGIDRLLRRVIARIEALGLEVFAVIDHSGEADEAGLTMPETKLVLFGSAQTATSLMLAHPHIALDLPLKLLICERDDGHCEVSYHAPDQLAQRHGLIEGEAEVLRAVETIAHGARSTMTSLNDVVEREPPPPVAN